MVGLNTGIGDGPELSTATAETIHVKEQERPVHVLSAASSVGNTINATKT